MAGFFDFFLAALEAAFFRADFFADFLAAFFAVFFFEAAFFRLALLGAAFFLDADFFLLAAFFLRVLADARAGARLRDEAVLAFFETLFLVAAFFFGMRGFSGRLQ